MGTVESELERAKRNVSAGEANVRRQQSIIDRIEPTEIAQLGDARRLMNRFVESHNKNLDRLAEIEAGFLETPAIKSDCE